MSINITDNAKVKLKEVMEQSQYKNPALRIVFNGFG